MPNPPFQPLTLSPEQLLSDLQAEYPLATKQECDECANCGPMVMCAEHSFISALHRQTWTTGAIEREQLAQEAASLRQRLELVMAQIRGQDGNEELTDALAIEARDVRDRMEEAEHANKWTPEEHEKAVAAIQASENLPPNHYPSFQERVWWKAMKAQLAQAQQERDTNQETAERLASELMKCEAERDHARSGEDLQRLTALENWNKYGAAQSRASQAEAATPANGLVELATELDGLAKHGDKGHVLMSSSLRGIAGRLREQASAQYGTEVLCESCAVVFCPNAERLHFHHDGCPQCDVNDCEASPRVSAATPAPELTELTWYRHNWGQLRKWLKDQIAIWDAPTLRTQKHLADMARARFRDVLHEMDQRSAGNRDAPVSAAERPAPTWQPIEWVEGVIRFRANKIVRYLLNSHPKVDMNELAIMDFSIEDREQFLQLIGYSVSGFGELDYVRRESVERADAIAASLPAPPGPVAQEKE